MRRRAKEMYHLEEAAIAGHPSARHNLACYEERKGRADRARKHRIGSSLQSLEVIVQ